MGVDDPLDVRTVDMHTHYIPPEFLEDAASNPAWRARVKKPWGGVKESGVGRESGWESSHDFTHIKSITVRTAADDVDWYSGENVAATEPIRSGHNETLARSRQP